MQSQKIIRKKFSKKYDFLETSLFEFLNWRQVSHFGGFCTDPKNDPQNQFIISNKNNLTSERILLKESLNLSKTAFFSEDQNSVHQTQAKSFKKINRNFSLGSELNDFSFNDSDVLKKIFFEKMNLLQLHISDFVKNQKPGDFFPQKKRFMQYWIFPLLGFVGLTWNKNPSFPILFSQNQSNPFKTSLLESSKNNDTSIFDSKMLILKNKDIHLTENLFYKEKVSDNSIASVFPFEKKFQKQNKLEKNFTDLYSFSKVYKKQIPYANVQGANSKNHSIDLNKNYENISKNFENQIQILNKFYLNELQKRIFIVFSQKNNKNSQVQNKKNFFNSNQTQFSNEFLVTFETSFQKETKPNTENFSKSFFWVNSIFSWNWFDLKLDFPLNQNSKKTLLFEVDTPIFYEKCTQKIDPIPAIFFKNIPFFKLNSLNISKNTTFFDNIIDINGSTSTFLVCDDSQMQRPIIPTNTKISLENPYLNHANIRKSNEVFNFQFQPSIYDINISSNKKLLPFENTEILTPIHSYNKAKLILENITKICELAKSLDNETNQLKTVSIYSLNKLKNKEKLFNNNLNKSKLLYNLEKLLNNSHTESKFSLLMLNNKKSFKFVDLNNQKSKNNSTISKKSLFASTMLVQPKNYKKESSFIKLTTKKLNFDLDRVFLFKNFMTFESEIQKQIQKQKQNIYNSKQLTKLDNISSNQKSISIYNTRKNILFFNQNLFKSYKKLKYTKNSGLLLLPTTLKETKSKFKQIPQMKKLTYELILLNYLKNSTEFPISFAFLKPHFKNKIALLKKSRDSAFDKSYLIPNQNNNVFQTKQTTDENYSIQTMVVQEKKQNEFILNEKLLNKFKKVQKMLIDLNKFSQAFELQTKSEGYGLNLNDSKNPIQLENPIVFSGLHYPILFNQSNNQSKKTPFNWKSFINWRTSYCFSNGIGSDFFLEKPNEKAFINFSNFEINSKQSYFTSEFSKKMIFTKANNTNDLIAKNSNQPLLKQSFQSDLKNNWILYINSFSIKFTYFLNNLSKQISNVLKKQPFYFFETNHNLTQISKGISSDSFPTISNKFRLRKKFIKRKKWLNKSVWVKSMDFKEKNKKEKIFRTLLSYKSSNNSNKNTMLSSNLLFSKKKQERNPFLKQSFKSPIEKEFIYQILNRLKTRMKNQVLLLNRRFNKNKKKKIYKKLHIKFKVNRQIPFVFETSLSFLKPRFKNSKAKKVQNKVFLKRNLKNEKQKKRNEISLNYLLKRIGFVFLSESKVNKNLVNTKISAAFDNVKSGNESLNLSISENLLFKRLEKEKSLQKKRRRKKLKLETRRRKKRKRFYPRPIWLRYSLYKKFLTSRHNKFFYFETNFFSKAKKIQKLNKKHLKSKSILFSSFYKKNKSNFQKLGLKNGKFKKIIYRNNKQKWGSFIQDTPTFEKMSLKKFSLATKLPIYQNQEFYKISNQIMNEFQPLCWKSYWLRSNLTPYMNRIQKNFQKMKQIEKSEHTIDSFRSFLSSLLGFHLIDFSLNLEKFVETKGVPQFSQNLSFYSHFKNTFENQHEFYVSNLSVFERTRNIAEYNRILFERISEILKNVKSNMNLDGQNQAKSYKLSHSKFSFGKKESKNIQKKNFWNNLALKTTPNLTAFSPFTIFSNLNNNSSLKPYGSNATLRVFWSFNKTNIFTFKEKNQIRDLWESYKVREQSKSNQTRKFLLKSLKLFSPSLTSLEQKTLKTPGSKKMNRSTIQKFEKIQKKLYYSALFQKNSHILNLLNNSLEGAQKTSTSGQTLGKQVYKTIVSNENSKHYESFLRQFKFHLKSKLFFISKKDFINKKNLFEMKNPTIPFEKPRVSKSSTFFWWSSKNYQMPFNLNSLNLFDNIPSSNTPFADAQELILKRSFKNQASILKLPRSEASNKDFKIENLNQSQRFIPVLEISTKWIWICSILFHLCILFSFIRIPELRGLFKFQALVFYKICNSYFIVLYSIYDLLKKYKQQTIQSLSILPKLSSLKPFDFAETNSSYESSNKKKPNSLFSLKTKDFQKLYKNESSDVLKLCLKTTEFYKLLEKLEKEANFANSNTFNENKISKVPLVSFNNIKSIEPKGILKKEKLRVFGASNNFFQIELMKQKLHSWQKIFMNQIFKNRIKNREILLDKTFPTQINSESLIINNSFIKYLEFVNSKNLKLTNRKQWNSRNNENIEIRKKRTVKEKIFEWNLNVPRIYSFDWFSSLKIKVLKTTGVQTNLASQSPFIYSFSKNLKQLFYSKIILNQPLSITNVFQKILYKQVTYNNMKFQTQVALSLLFLTKSTVILSSNIVQLSYQLLLKIIDLFESLLLVVYKFLEKPAELMIEWIAQIFLIEWSSDISTFIPETLDTNFWNSFQKFSRSSRILGGSVIDFQNYSNSCLFFQLPQQLFSSNNMVNTNVIQSFFLFPISNTIGYLMQRRLWCFFHLFLESIFKPDMDLMVRQKKGQIFWDIWAEILIQAAEKYNINIPSLTSLKEEQEKLIERLLQDSSFFYQYDSKSLNNQTLNQNTDLALTKASDVFKQNLKTKTTLQTFHSFSNLSLDLKSEAYFETLFQTNGFLKRNFKINNTNASKFTQNTDFSIFSLLNNEALFLDSYRLKNWSSNQYVTSQATDTDLFMDISPPKSFQHVHFMKYYEPIQYTLGSIMCEVYSGLFSMKVSKNLLIVGSKPQNGVRGFNTNQKFSPFNSQSSLSYGSLMIQALAGETEMKMMIDNAHRYASIQRGVAVGMKLLRDVFESIALQTPSFFLIEDIHVIGERRPMLISDDENSKAMQSVFGLEQDEVHEKNQLIYQLSRHAITDFRRPYKGDFSMLIPTNQYNSDLYKFSKYQTILKSSAQKIQKKHPLPIPSIESQLNTQNSANELNSNKSSEVFSRLQILSEKFFAPPATSPFTILMMKEQKKLKPKKMVKQISWAKSFSSIDPASSKETESIRVKVALLADITLRNFSVKLDMITDLLVIVDSVRSNRGFVVFATTHVPSILDPALRRPGRFDETIALPMFPNLMNRWGIFEMSFSNEFNSQKNISDIFRIFPNASERNILEATLPKQMDGKAIEIYDRLDYGMLTQNLTHTQISDMISKTKLFLLNPSHFNLTNKVYNSKINAFSTLMLKKQTNLYPKFQVNIFSKNPIYSPTQAFETLFMDYNSIPYLTDSKKSFKNNNNVLQAYSNSNVIKTTHTISLAYSKVGSFMILLDFLKDQTSYSLMNWSSVLDDMSPVLYNSLYSPNSEFKNNMMQFLGGKVAEFFVASNQRSGMNLNNNFNSGVFQKNSGKLLSKVSSFSLIDQQIQHQSWRSTTTFIFSILQKRYLYNKNLIVSKMLSFENPNRSSLKEPPSPPASSLLMPSKKYENFKRTERDFQQKSIFSIHEKMQMHQKQRFLKKLYNQPIQEYFQSQIFENRLTTFSSSFKELASLDSILLKTSSSHSYYKNRFLMRHRFSLINQWWNGQLAEHNAETTYLSDVDWRSMYVQSMNKNQNTEIQLTTLPISLSGELVDSQILNKSLTPIQARLNQKHDQADQFIDFPDAEQHYNPRSRRWFLHTNSWNYWLSFENALQYEIYSHFIMESFYKTYIYFNKNRELLDYFVFKFLQKGSLKELDFIFTFSRFYIK
uniref:Cell division protein n=1 Tax=Chlorotetraedron incus TaxID=162317 RepID=A0A140HAA1_9CHLO|nr:cell division protein [Chlorotetraedron incus]AMO01100.1 cell division protein [Chlorotetraedron incus]